MFQYLALVFSLNHMTIQNDLSLNLARVFKQAQEERQIKIEKKNSEMKERLKDRSREKVPEEEHNLPLTGLQLTGWGVLML